MVSDSGSRSTGIPIPAMNYNIRLDDSIGNNTKERFSYLMSGGIGPWKD